MTFDECNTLIPILEGLFQRLDGSCRLLPEYAQTDEDTIFFRKTASSLLRPFIILFIYNRLFSQQGQYGIRLDRPDLPLYLAIQNVRAGFEDKNAIENIEESTIEHPAERRDNEMWQIYGELGPMDATILHQNYCREVERCSEWKEWKVLFTNLWRVVSIRGKL